MDNFRLILAITLVFLGMMIWQKWQEDYVNPKTQPEKASVSAVSPANSSTGNAGEEDVPSVTVNSSAESPSLPPTVKEEPHGKIVHVKTDVLSLKIDTRGGTVIEAKLLEYAKSSEEKDKKFVLLSDQSTDYFLIQSGLIGVNESTAPNHKAHYQAEKDDYRLSEGSDTLTVPLIWTDKSGLKVAKIYTFKRSNYLVLLTHKVFNESTAPWVGADYRQFVRGKPSVKKDSTTFARTYTGGAYYTPEQKFEKIDFEEMNKTKLSLDVTGGWVAMVQHYFFSAVIPVLEEQQHFYSKKPADNRYILGTYGPTQKIEPGKVGEFSGKLWMGPKLQERLEKVAPGLEYTTDYGWLTIIAKPIFWMLDFIHSGVGNWGWSIIFLTILIKLAFYRLSATSYRSMAGMRKLAPRLQAIKEKYGDDKERQQKAMMDLYKTEKINPLGGCLPILVQIPVFIALYWVLLETVELRNAPFMLWIDNLSAKDPYFVLPIIMGISMIVQQKLNPPPPDPMQAKIMMALPFIFTAMFAFFPAGLVLYWVVNNLLSIAQQWRITYVMEKTGK